MPMFCFCFVWLGLGRMVKEMADSSACSSCCVFGGEPLCIMMLVGGIKGDSWTVEFCWDLSFTRSFDCKGTFLFASCFVAALACPKATVVLAKVEVLMEVWSVDDLVEFASFRFGKRVAQKLEVVSELKEKGREFKEVADQRKDDPMDDQIPSELTVGLESKFHEVWRCYEENQVKIIGLYGKGGVGKTALLNQIYKIRQTSANIMR
ncbi:hypothetical protein Patl1_03758 [Pistacia atlantica]|uniref:Uncharacterized protein n=1 Tax=Pistacia atlantica TaxID=434234 RepID=A0ACC1BPZ7_9ROSI|nr:hypothetical protein Patl1_03758 [Pistacia atlantica]